MWNRVGLPIQEKREECLGTRILCCQCFFCNTNTTCIQVCPVPGRKRRDPEFWPFDGQAWWKETAATAWEICSGKPAGRLCPSNHQVDVCWSSDGAVAITKHRLFPVLGFCCGALSPRHHWFISEGWNKNAACPICVVHVQSLTGLYQNEAILFKRRMREAEPRFGAEGKGMLHLVPDLGFWPSVSLLPEGICLASRLESAGTHCLFAHWVQQWREGSGDFFSLHSIASSQENLPPKLFQSPSTYVATLSKAQKCHGGI